MDEGLSGGHGASDRAVIIIADGEDPGVIAGGDQAGRRSAGGSVARTGGSDGSRAIGAGGVNSLEAGHGDRRGDALGKSGGDIDVT